MTAMATPPVMLFIAPARGSDAIAGLAASQLAAVIEAPLSDADLASALLGILAGDERLAKFAEPSRRAARAASRGAASDAVAPAPGQRRAPARSGTGARSRSRFPPSPPPSRSRFSSPRTIPAT